MSKVNSKLLREAIADAKLVRETAHQQAKAALEEAFRPQIQSMISKKLQTEIDDEKEEIEIDAEETEEIEEEIDSSDIGDSDNEEPSKDASAETTEDPEGEIDVDSEHDTAKESDLTEGEDEEEIDLEIEDDEDDEEETDELDLESIIKELESEVEDEEEEEIDLETEQEDVEDEEEDEEIDIEIDDEDESEEEGEGEDEEIDIELDDEELDDEDLDEDEEIDIEIDDEELDDEEDELAEVQNVAVADKLKGEIVKLKGQFKESIKVVKYQKEKLNEVNILNAKLLFVNRIFREFNLDNVSKVKIIENFDRAKNVREIKLIYATLMENMNMDKKKTINKTRRLIEGSSKVQRSTKPKIDESIVEYEQINKNRIKKLAGIK